MILDFGKNFDSIIPNKSESHSRLIKHIKDEVGRILYYKQKYQNMIEYNGSGFWGNDKYQTEKDYENTGIKAYKQIINYISQNPNIVSQKDIEYVLDSLLSSTIYPWYWTFQYSFHLIKLLGYPKKYCQIFLEASEDYGIITQEKGLIIKYGNVNENYVELTLNGYIKNIYFYKNINAHCAFDNIIKLLSIINNGQKYYSRLITKLSQYGVKELINGAQVIGYKISKREYQFMYNTYCNLVNINSGRYRFEQDLADYLLRQSQ